jgi:predicted O-methyltransferase YrrM
MFGLLKKNKVFTFACIFLLNVPSMIYGITRDEPWLTERAVGFLEKFFQEKPNAYVLEFGSGASTLWIAKHTSHFYSIEHSKLYYDLIQKQLHEKGYNRVTYLFSQLPYYHLCNEFPDDFFDLIIVDGRNRKGCIVHAIPKLKSGGVLLLDNAERPYYHGVFSLLREWKHVSTEQKGPDKFGFWYKGWKTDWWIKP